jgi:hypothetical protein
LLNFVLGGVSYDELLMTLGGLRLRGNFGVNIEAADKKYAVQSEIWVPTELLV